MPARQLLARLADYCERRDVARRLDKLTGRALMRPRFLFLYDRRPCLIRSVLVALLLAGAGALLLAHWAELQGGFPP